MIIENDAYAVALVGLDRRPRRAPVEPPEIECPARNDHLFHRFRDQVEDLHAVVERERQVFDVRRQYRWGCASRGFRGTRLLCRCELRNCDARPYAENIPEKISSSIHNPSPFE